MQFSVKNLQNNRLAHPLLRVGPLPARKILHPPLDSGTDAILKEPNRNVLKQRPNTGLRQHTGRMQCVARVMQQQFSALSELLFLFMFIATYFWSDKTVTLEYPVHI